MSKEKPVVPPLSVVMDDSEKNYMDVALKGEADLFNNKSPKFSPDWKNTSKIRKLFGWDEDDGTKKEIRIRTAIDKGARRADESKLFSYEMVIPCDHVWMAKISLDEVPIGALAKVRAQLKGLLTEGFHDIGKTSARGDAVVSPISPATRESVNWREDEIVIITLQTPAILIDPLDKSINGVNVDGAAALLKAYQSIWSEISENSLTLVRIFARQGMYGGYYLHKRFGGVEPYYPYLLTEPGSVFVFYIKDKATVENKIPSWMKRGLPLPNWAIARYKMESQHDWTRCPYVRQNGYGEIMVNHECHDWETWLLVKEGENG
jgi:hypothetical protein